MLALFLLMALSAVTLGGFSYRDNPQFVHLYKQLTWFLIGLAAFFFFSRFDYRILISHTWPILAAYAFSIVLLLLTFAGPEIRGAHAWIVLGPLQFQPVELLKFVLLLAWAKYFSRRHVEIALARNLFGSVLFAAVPAIIIARQPDLGSIVILVFLWLVMVLVSGITIKHLAIVGVALCVLSFIFWHAFLQEYQKERILSFLFPMYDPLGASYNIIQSKIAIGSGGFLGKGVGKGTQVQYGFLPEAKTDFIFAGIAEEWGLVGALFLIGAFGFMIYRILVIAYFTGDNFSKLFCLGAAGLFMIQFFLNVGSNIGLVPVTGVTLPLISYGGSSILISMAILGVVQSVATRMR